jgi:transglutaminase-like putative cysteine protease
MRRSPQSLPRTAAYWGAAARGAAVRAARHRREQPRSGRRQRLARGPIEQLGGRIPVLGVIGLAALAGLLFGPVFGSAFPGALVVPIACLAWPHLERWRAGTSVVLGLAVIVETTLRATTAGGRPTGASIRALYEGVRRSWLLTLQSTWPARADPQLVVFVPLLALAAMVIAVHVVVRTRARLPALLPSLLVVGLSQAYHPMAGPAAVLAVLIYAAGAAAVVGAWPKRGARLATITVLSAVLAGLLGGFGGSAFDPAHRHAYSLQDVAPPVPTPTSVISPLDEIAYRLAHPQVPLFSVSASAGTDRWPLAVLDRFDGVNWTSSAKFRYLGSRIIADRSLAVPTRQRQASVTVDALPGPWLPSQRGLDAVSGLRPLVDETTGTLLSGTVKPGTQYSLRWSSPDIGSTDLTRASLTPHAATGTAGMGAVPAAVVAVAKAAAGTAPPTLQTALLLERYLRQHYRRAVGPDLPAGHGWPQIVHFLANPAPKGGSSGTSEQFAAAYVALARVIGIPARLVVGFQQPDSAQPDGTYTIRNGDVYAWPEVAVRGVGWIPLDPMGAQSDSGTDHASTPLARATQQARVALPPPQNPPPTSTPKVPSRHDAPTGQSSSTLWIADAAIALLAGIVGALLAVPLAKWLRGSARRRRTGNAAVAAAWLETRDRLRDYGVHVSSGMTVREVARAGLYLIDSPAQHALDQLGDLVDSAMWSGTAVTRRAAEVAWRSYDTIRRSLDARPFLERLSAGVAVRGLRPLR